MQQDFPIFGHISVGQVSTHSESSNDTWGPEKGDEDSIFV